MFCPQISEHIERLVNLLQGEEAPGKNSEDDLGDYGVRDVPHDDAEDEDSKIEEV